MLRGGLRESWTCPNPGWIQFCDAVEVDSKGLVVKIGGAPLDLKVTKGCVSSPLIWMFFFFFQRIYRVGSFVDFDTDYGTPSIHHYFQEHLKLINNRSFYFCLQTEEGRAGLPDTDAGIGCHALLLQLFSKDIWSRYTDRLSRCENFCLYHSGGKLPIK